MDYKNESLIDEILRTGRKMTDEELETINDEEQALNEEMFICDII